MKFAETAKLNPSDQPPASDHHIIIFQNARDLHREKKLCHLHVLGFPLKVKTKQTKCFVFSLTN